MKVEFELSVFGVRGSYTEPADIDDDTTDEQIDEMLQVRVNDRVDSSWKKL
jgi:uncharacterized protein YggL (DUF469 family)